VQTTDALLLLARALAESGDPLEIMWIVTDCVRELYACDVASIQLRRPDGSYALAYSIGEMAPEERELLRTREFDHPSHAILERERRVIAIDDVPSSSLADPDYLALLRRRSTLLVPFVSREELLGYCAAHYIGAAHHFTEREVALAEGIAGQVALALDNARLRAAERQKSSRLEALHAVAADMLAHRELDEVLLAVADHALRLTGRELGGVLLWDEQEAGLRVVAARGERHFKLGQIQRGATVSVNAFRTNQALVANDYRRYANAEVDAVKAGVRAVVAVPLQLADQPIGTLTVSDQNPARGFGPHDVAVLELLAGHAALAIERARLLQREREAARLQGAIETARGLAHELNQPLAVVMGHAEILRRMTDSARPLCEVYESLDQIAQAANALTERILLLQRIVRMETRELPGVGRYIDLQRSTSSY
jgi:GAF domain-containing protein